jgi:hypothetical protein
MVRQVAANDRLSVREIMIFNRDPLEKFGQPSAELVPGFGVHILRHENRVIAQQSKLSLEVASLNRRFLLFRDSENLPAIQFRSRVNHKVDLQTRIRLHHAPALGRKRAAFP